MSDSDAPTPPRPAPASSKPSARPSRPQIERPTSGNARPVRPGGGRAKATDWPAVEELPAEPIIADTLLIAPPPTPAIKPKPPRVAVYGSAFVRQTLLPPCAVLGVGLLGLGVAYFLQPPDAALRQVPPGVPVTLLAVGAVALACAVGLARSLRRIDSPGADS
ncbi:MAG TPA: hypothetical protein VF595_15600 [Tepidisphaeraceae bacterium]|jgi:hypothetical protein